MVLIYIGARQAKLFTATIIAAIFSSTMAFVLEMFPSFRVEHDEGINLVEVVCVIIFSIEIGLRLFAADSYLRLLKDPLFYLDWLAILPFYFELVLAVTAPSSAALFRVVRVGRIFRLIKISRHLKWLRVSTFGIRTLSCA